MKRFVILLLMLVTITTFCSSQIIHKSTTALDSTRIIITDKQLKTANLIFIEHSKLLKENKILLKQIDNYKMLDNLNLKTDSIRLVQINNYEILNNQLKKENKKLKVQRNIFGLTGLSFGLAFIFTMLFK